MAIEHLLRNDAGIEHDPTTDDQWRDWVSGSKTRNFCNEDPLLDWLETWGRQKGYLPDNHDAGDEPDPTDFLEFLFAQGKAFEDAVVEHIHGIIPVVRIVPPGPEAWAENRSMARARQTYLAMEAGAAIIVQGVLRNPETRTYGAPDLLVRSDALEMLVPGTLTHDQATVPASAFDHGYHYRVVDVKFSSLGLDAQGHVASNKAAYMAQTHLYNAALGRLQEYLPPYAYLLGRGWEQTKQGKKTRVANCMDRLGPVKHDYSAPRKDFYLPHVAQQAVEWVRRVRTEGEAWEIYPEPTIPELRPNMKADQDAPWHTVKKELATQLGDLTLAWQARANAIPALHKQGITRWDDSRVTAESLGHKPGGETTRRLDELLLTNRGGVEPVRPARITAGEDVWRPDRLNFFVDFEWVSNIKDDFSLIPEANGNTCIFMIGCGHEEDGRWVFEQFTTEALTHAEEARIIRAWLDHMQAVEARLGDPDHPPRTFHWSPAEESALTTAFDSARRRHPENDWPEPRWFDLLAKTVRVEPVTVRGAMGFGLKAIARGLHGHGRIATSWGESKIDGLGAMVGAWSCEDEARATGVPMTDLPLMHEIGEYNEVDCKVMWEAVRYFRAAH